MVKRKNEDEDEDNSIQNLFEFAHDAVEMSSNFLDFLCTEENLIFLLEWHY